GHMPRSIRVRPDRPTVRQPVGARAAARSFDPREHGRILESPGIGSQSARPVTLSLLGRCWGGSMPLSDLFEGTGGWGLGVGLLAGAAILASKQGRPLVKGAIVGYFTVADRLRSLATAAT